MGYATETFSPSGGDWPVHCLMTHHTMTQMGDKFPNMVETKDLNLKRWRRAKGVPKILKFGSVSFKVFAALALAASAAYAPRSHAQTLEAHESGTGMGTVNHWPTYWRSYNRDYHQTKKIRITVRDMSRRSPDGEVRVYFIGCKQPQLDLFIYNHAILKVHFGGDMEVSDEIDAPSLFLHEKRYRYGEHYSYGAAMEGWIAEGRVGARVFGTVASNQNLLAIAKSDALQKMIATAGIYSTVPEWLGTPSGVKVEGA